MKVEHVAVSTHRLSSPTKPSTFWQRMGCGLFGLSGVVLLVYSLYGIVEASAFVLSARLAEGKVVSVHPENPDDPTGATSVVKVVFPVAGGEATARIATQLDYRPGESVAVVYPPEDPTQARFNSFWHLYGHALIALVIALALTPLLVLAMAGVVRGRRHGPQSTARDARAADDELFRFVHDGPTTRFAVGTVTRSEEYELTDEAGRTHRFGSPQQCPAEVRAQFQRMQENMRRAIRGGSGSATFTYTDESGVEQTYHSLDEMPPEVRRVFEDLSSWDDR